MQIRATPFWGATEVVKRTTDQWAGSFSRFPINGNASRKRRAATLLEGCSRCAGMRRDAPGGLALYACEVVPRCYGKCLAYMLYRWEIIIRESAIIGMLGVAALGRYIDAAVSDLRLDAAVVLIVCTVLLSAVIDYFSRRLRPSRRIGNLPRQLSRHDAASNAGH